MRNKYLIFFVSLLFLTTSCSIICSIIEDGGKLMEWAEASTSSGESMNKGVFDSYYHCEPFEYSDSVFSMRLVFKEVFTEYWHWYSNKDKCWKHTDHKYVVAIIDTLLSDLGIEHIDSNQYINTYWKFDVAVYTTNFKKYDIFSLRPNRDEPVNWDSVIIPIRSYPCYNKCIGLDGREYKYIKFGELVFIRKQ